MASYVPPTLTDLALSRCHSVAEWDDFSPNTTGARTELLGTGPGPHRGAGLSLAPGSCYPVMTRTLNARRSSTSSVLVVGPDG